jgi:tripartite-type tricarboxylate transporter receptor subunit TctC
MKFSVYSYGRKVSKAFSISALAALTAFTWAIVAVPDANAQSYPEREIVVVVPYAPGGGMDIFARMIGDSLSGHWNQPVVIDNRPGASGAVGAAHAAEAEPDGCTLLLGSNAVNGTNELLRLDTIPYKTREVFEPLAVVAAAPLF